MLDDRANLGTYAWGKAVCDFLVSGLSREASSMQAKKGIGNLHIQGCTALLQVKFFFYPHCLLHNHSKFCFILKLTIDVIIYADMGMRALGDWSEEC